MPLTDLIVRTEPRETSGPRSANRFEFQKSWALCRLLELHKSGQDYLIVFDYHDDVLVLNSSTSPDRVDFYQIKTKQSGHWTLGDLIRREQGSAGALPSILGKMLGNKLQFPEHTGALNFVSTQGFRLSVKGRADSIVQRVCLAELTPTELGKVINALRVEHSLSQDPECADCTHLQVTSLSLGDHATHAMGALGKFLNELYPGERVCLNAIYQALCDEIRRKTHSERRPHTFADLCAERAISRDGFAGILKDVKPGTEFDTRLKEAVAQLQAEEVPFDDIRQIREGCELHEIERMDKTNIVVCRAREAIAKAVAAARTQGVPSRLSDAIAAIAGVVKRETKALRDTKSAHYQSAMIVMALYDF